MKYCLGLLFVLLVTGLQVQAQTPKPKTTTAPKWKPPKVKTVLAAYSDSVSVMVDEANHLITLPLKVTDDKKNAYTIVTYQFLYKRRTVTEDEQTGRTSPSSSIVSQIFRETPLPELWLKIIKDELQTGEEFFFFDVVAKDTQGHLFFAPNLKITTR